MALIPSDVLPGQGIGVAIPAAGFGARMGGVKKAFLMVDGEPLLQRAIRPFLNVPGVVAIVVALPPDDSDEPPSFLKDLDSRVRWVPGGETRLRSVHEALRALPAGLRIALVHDAARPVVSPDIIGRCVTAAEAGVGAVAGWPVVDTVQRVDTAGYIKETPDRNGLWQAQTPQAFPFDQLRDAYARAIAEGLDATDEASVFRAFGGQVQMVLGAPWNMKVTHPGDAEIATRLLHVSDTP